MVEVLRSDARRNRERLIASARALFAARGVDIPVDDVVEAAGVGMGTLYRHFPTKEDLIDAVLEDAFRDYLAIADRALTSEDPWSGLEAFLDEALAASAANRGLADAAAGRRAAMMRRLKPRLRDLAERAGIDPDDLVVALQGGAGVVERAPSAQARRRYVSVVVRGLQP